MIKYFNRLLIHFLEEKLLKSFLLMPMASYEPVGDQVRNDCFSFYLKYPDIEFVDLEALIWRFKQRSSDYKIYHSLIFFVHEWFPEKDMRSSEIKSFIKSNITLINEEVIDESMTTASTFDLNVEDFDQEIMREFVVSVNNNCLNKKISLTQNEIQYDKIIEVNDALREWNRYRVRGESSQKNNFTIEFFKEIRVDFKFNELIIFLFGKTTTKFTKYCKERMFNLNGHIDVAFLIHSLIIPNKKQLTIEQLKRLLNLAPKINDLWEKEILSTDYFDLIYDDFKKFNDIILNNFAENRVKYKENLDRLTSTYFSNYTFNQLEVLFSARYGYVLFLMHLFKGQEDDLQNGSEKIKPISVYHNFTEMIVELLPAKKINNEKMNVLHNYKKDNYKFKLLQTYEDYKNTGILFGNCVASYYVDKPDLDVISVIDINKGGPVACVSFEQDGSIDQILGKGNSDINKELRQELESIFENFLDT